MNQSKHFKNTKFKATEKTVLREYKPPPMPKSQPKVIWDSNQDCQINLDLDVCQISQNVDSLPCRHQSFCQLS